MTTKEPIIQDEVEYPAQTGISTNGAFHSNARPSDSPFTGKSATDLCNFIGPDGLWAIATDATGAIAFWVYNEGSPIKAMTIKQDGTVQIPNLVS